MEEKRRMDRLPSQNLLQRAQEYHFRDSLDPGEYEALMHLSSELVPPPSCEAQFFILGSYKTDEKQRLLHLKREIERDYCNSRAYLMEEFTDDLHPIVQFKLIADYSDYVIGVCEHDSGGFQLELGMLVALMNYFDRCHLLKRRYSESEERENYNWMLSAGVFDMFEYGNRLYEWETPEEYASEVTGLLESLQQ